MDLNSLLEQFLGIPFISGFNSGDGVHGDYYGRGLDFLPGNLFINYNQSEKVHGYRIDGKIIISSHFMLDYYGASKASAFSCI